MISEVTTEKASGFVPARMIPTAAAKWYFSIHSPIPSELHEGRVREKEKERKRGREMKREFEIEIMAALVEGRGERKGSRERFGDQNSEDGYNIKDKGDHDEGQSSSKEILFS